MKQMWAEAAGSGFASTLPYATSLDFCLTTSGRMSFPRSFPKNSGSWR